MKFMSNSGYSNLQGLLSKVQADELLSFRDRLGLLNGIGYVRAINFLANMLDIPYRLEVLREDDRKLWPKVYEYLSRLPTAAMINLQTEEW